MTSTVPQDTDLSADAVERAARAAVDDLNAMYQGTYPAAYVGDDDDLKKVVVDGRVDMLRLVRVVAAALKP